MTQSPYLSKVADAEQDIAAFLANTPADNSACYYAHMIASTYRSVDRIARDLDQPTKRPTLDQAITHLNKAMDLLKNGAPNASDAAWSLTRTAIELLDAVENELANEKTAKLNADLEQRSAETAAREAEETRELVRVAVRELVALLPGLGRWLKPREIGPAS